MTNPNHARLTSRGPAALAGLTLAALALTGCAAPAPTSAADSGGPVFAHVHGLGVDPADGAIQVASHDGLFQSGPDGLVPAGVPGRDLMGFTITGPGPYLSSGHPAPGDDLPNPLGLVETRDGGTTWTPLSLTGEVDFHALDVSQGTVFGYDATNGLLRASTDGGRSWEDRAELEALDIAVDPAEPARVLATTAGGVVASTDGGRSFGAPSGPQLAYLSWGPDGVVHGLDTGSTVFTSRDGGSTWQQAGTAPGGRPQAITATDDVLLVATAGGVYRSDDGRTFASVG
ncbi:MAG: exo-alpha-sialidase [Pseudonocardia sp.]|nr:exo-alpha-sialidase [Pseudonocardia sp.]